MKRYLLLILSVFLCVSCYDEKKHHFTDDGDFDLMSLGELLPSEAVEFYKEVGSTESYTAKIFFKYDNQNRLITVQGPLGTQSITYDAAGKISSLETNTALGNYRYKYEYDEEDKFTILERVFSDGLQEQVNTLTIDKKDQLVSKLDGETNVLTTYTYDSEGNLMNYKDNHYTYDNSKGWMSSVKTPHWLFHTQNGNIPGTHNLVNNVTSSSQVDAESNDSSSNTYDYTEYNNSKYPVKFAVSQASFISLKYIKIR